MVTGAGVDEARAGADEAQPAGGREGTGAGPADGGPADGGPAGEAQPAGESVWAPLEVLDSLLFPGQARYTSEVLTAIAGVPQELAERLWRAMGFTPVEDDEAAYLEDDLRALQQAVHALAFESPNEIIYQTRVMAAALSRVAEVTSDNIVARMEELRRAGATEAEIAATLSGPAPDEIDRLVGYMYRRQLRAALWRKLADPEHLGSHAVLAVGFVDLVRFTALTEDIAEDELADLIDRFESMVHDRVTAAGGRIVKMIGDEVMFVSERADQAAHIAIDLIEAFHFDDSVPSARAGLAIGPVLSHGGDYFGPVVNLASRIVDVARPSTVVASQDVYDQLASREEFSWRRLPPKRLKGIGRTNLYSIRPAPAAELKPVAPPA
jgi:adenylate cyclase